MRYILDKKEKQFKKRKKVLQLKKLKKRQKIKREKHGGDAKKKWK